MMYEYDMEKGMAAIHFQFCGKKEDVEAFAKAFSSPDNLTLVEQKICYGQSGKEDKEEKDYAVLADAD